MLLLQCQCMCGDSLLTCLMYPWCARRRLLCKMDFLGLSPMHGPGVAPVSMPMLLYERLSTHCWFLRVRRGPWVSPCVPFLLLCLTQGPKSDPALGTHFRGQKRDPLGGRSGVEPTIGSTPFAPRSGPRKRPHCLDLSTTWLMFGEPVQ